MKNILLKSLLQGVMFAGGIMLTIFGVYATSSLLSIQSVDNQTVLTSNLWNDTMSALTGAITDLDTSVVKLTGNQTIAGVKTFSSPITGITPVGNNDLATKNYVDTSVAAAGGESWVTVMKICGWGNGSGGGSDCTPPACDSGWIDLLGVSGAYPVGGYVSGGYWQYVYNKHRTCAQKR